MRKLINSVIVIILVQFIHESIALKGVINLDSVTFDKIVSKFKFSLVKVDIQYPYGDKHDEFTSAVNTLKNNDDILLAEVGVQDYGDNENQDLADRFKIVKDQFPRLLLFKDANLNEPIIFDGEWKINDLLAFVRSNTGIRVVLDSCISEMDEIAEQFMAAGGKRDQFLTEAKEKSTVVKEELKKNANVYLTIMQRVIERGDKFIDSERERVKNLIKGKLSDNKKKEMEARLNILQSFKPDIVDVGVKSEL